MKQSLKFLMFIPLLFALVPLAAQQFTCFPEKPMPGEKLTVKFNPTNTPLAGEPFDAVAYFFDPENSDPVAMTISLRPDNDGFVGEIPTFGNTNAVLFSFKNWDNEKEATNQEKGYKTLMYQADRLSPVEGAFAAKAKIYSNYGHLGGVKRDLEKAYNLLKTEIERFPSSKSDNKIYTSFANLAAKQKDETAVQEIRDSIKKMIADNESSEEIWLQAAALANIVGDQAWAKEISDQRAMKFPEGRAMQSEKLNQSYKAAGTPAEKAAVYEEAKTFHAGDKSKQRLLNAWASSAARGYADEGDWDNFEKYLAMITDRTSKAGVLNGLAWHLSGESLEATPKDTKKGLELSKRSMELIQQEMENPASMPIYYFPKRWKNDLEGSLGGYADTYALLAYHDGQFEDALNYQYLACEQDKFKNGETNERYAIYHEKLKTPKETEDLLAKLIAEGAATANMKAQHKRLFLANNSLESAYDQLAVQLEKVAVGKKRDELKEKMLDEKAPDFRLVNLKGEEVSAAGLRGKVVVLDFWATWCGPCKASFPGMQKAVDKFSKNQDVAFVFIDTWERGEDKAKNASDFVASKGYTFNVLMDNEDKTVADFGVSGIPTKFVVDKNGMIRFKSVGFNGNDDDLVAELTTMIELAGGSAPLAARGAP